MNKQEHKAYLILLEKHEKLQEKYNKLYEENQRMHEKYNWASDVAKQFER